MTSATAAAVIPASVGSASVHVVEGWLTAAATPATPKAASTVSP